MRYMRRRKKQRRDSKWLKKEKGRDLCRRDRKKKKETEEIEEAVVKEIENEIEREVEKEVEKEVMEEEKTEANRLEGCLTYEVEQQQEEKATTTEMDKVTPRTEHSKQKRRKHNWYLVRYDKNVCTEKNDNKNEISYKGEVTEGENVKAILIDKEKYSRWKETCRFEPPTYEVEFSELPSVVELN
uniref:Uncharacterized protein n=1 Tax=Octopus bimaculoides TaxID=37653 RepID=A0A0L8HZ78_OCTBM